MQVSVGYARAPPPDVTAALPEAAAKPMLPGEEWASLFIAVNTAFTSGADRVSPQA